jgi:hypothetical protein
MTYPTFNNTALMCDDPELAAQLSICLAVRGKYLPIMDMPRLARGDAHAEVIRRTNAIVHSGCERLVLAGATEAVKMSLKGHIHSSFIDVVDTFSDNSLNAAGVRLRKGTPIQANRGTLGASLLTALREKRQIEFTNDAPELRYVPPKLDHLIVCEDSKLLSQVIAANYAFSLGAGLILIPSPSDDDITHVSEAFYSAPYGEDGSSTDQLEALAKFLRARLGDIPLAGVRSITFITSGLPWGFGLQELPTTHLFTYPDLGLAIIHGIAASLDDSKPLRLAAMIDPGTVGISEVVKAGQSLVDRGTLVMAFRNRRANIQSVSLVLDLLPYDLLYIATHCGDVHGQRETHKFVDSSGDERTLVIDTALQINPVMRGGKYEVKAYERFVSIDNVPWEDKEHRLKVVDNALLDFFSVPLGERKPAFSEDIDRVAGSAALSMFDGNLLATPMNAGGNSYPFVINNACVSWHELAARFMFGGCRGYIGTLTEVDDAEAEALAMGILNKYIGRPLAQALWSTQNDPAAGEPRRPYVMVGVHFQRFQTEFKPPHAYILQRLRENFDYWRNQLQRVDAEDEDALLSISERVEFLKECIDTFTRQ